MMLETGDDDNDEYNDNDYNDHDAGDRLQCG